MRLSLVATAVVAAFALGPTALALDEICTAADTCVLATGRTCDRIATSCPPCVSISAFGTNYRCVNRSGGRCPEATSDCTATPTTTPSPSPTPTPTSKAPVTTIPPTSAPPTSEPPTEQPTTQPPVESASDSASGSAATGETEAPTTTAPATKKPKTTQPPTLEPETEAPTPNVTEAVEPRNSTVPTSDVQNNSSKESSGLKLPVILAIVAGGVVVVAVVAFLIWKRNRDDDDDDDDDDYAFSKPAYTARAAGAGGAAGVGAASASAYGSAPSNLSKTTYAYSSNPAAPTSPEGNAPGLANYPASRYGTNRYGRYGSAKFSGTTDYGVPSTMFLAPGGHADAARGSLSGSNSSSEEKDVWGNSRNTSSTNSKKAESPATPLGGTREARSDSYEF